MAFKLPELPYAYDSLEPSIDKETMQIHHDKHFAGYTNNLNAAIEGTDLAERTIEDILTNLDMSQSAVRNNGGGYFNHRMFFSVLSPNGGGEPTGELADLINSSFGSFQDFKDKFSAAAKTQFGSGFAWLCYRDGKLDICSTPNQDNPLMPGVGCGGTPIMGLDVWEHAYYLHYQNRRPDYVEAFWNVVNWEQVAKNYAG